MVWIYRALAGIGKQKKISTEKAGSVLHATGAKLHGNWTRDGIRLESNGPKIRTSKMATPKRAPDQFLKRTSKPGSKSENPG